MLITWVEADIEADIYFPSFDMDKWKVSMEKKNNPDDKNPYTYTFTEYILRK